MFAIAVLLIKVCPGETGTSNDVHDEYAFWPCVLLGRAPLLGRVFYFRRGAAKQCHCEVNAWNLRLQCQQLYGLTESRTNEHMNSKIRITTVR